MFLANSLILRSKIIHHLNKVSTQASTVSFNADSIYTTLDIILSYPYFAMIVTNLILSAFSEKYLYKSAVNSTQKMPMQASVSLISYLLFWWTNSLIKTGFKRDLVKEDLYEIGQEYKSATIANHMKIKWDTKTQEYLSKLRDEKNDAAKSTSKKLTYKSKRSKEDTTDEEIKLTDLNETTEIKTVVTHAKEPSLTLCLLKLFGISFVQIILIKLVHDLLNFARPMLLDKLINFIKEKDQKTYVGFFYIFLLCLTSFSQTLMMQHYQQNGFILGYQIKIGLMNLIFRKSLKLSTSARKETTVGEMTNLLATNTSTFERCFVQLVQVILLPIQLIITTYMLWQYLRWATFAGIASMVLFMPINTYFARLSKSIHKNKYKLQDSRIKTINEVLTGIRVIKFYGWEISFIELVKKLRGRELTNLIKTSLVSTLSHLTLSIASFVVAGVSFATFILIDENNQLDPSTAFVSLTLINMLRNHLRQIPRILTILVNLNVSLTRIRKFLLRDEIQNDDITHNITPEHAIIAKDVNLGWSKSETLLNDVNMEVKKGKLVAICGKVGSGKSSLLAGLLGEMHKLNESGQINVDGTVAYVPQQAWIQNATVKNNILFNNPFNEELYKNVIKSCSLLADLDIMVAGDNTEIGEKGNQLRDSTQKYCTRVCLILKKVA